MKKFFLPIFAVLLVLGSILPLAAYRVTRAVLSGQSPHLLPYLRLQHLRSRQVPCLLRTPRPFWWRIRPPDRCWSFPVRNTFWVLSPPRCR